MQRRAFLATAAVTVAALSQATWAAADANLVKLRARGVREISVWLTRDMIDWARPVRVSLNGNTPVGYKPKVLTPDVEFMLNDYRDRGDRRLLFLSRLEIQSPF